MTFTRGGRIVSGSTITGIATLSGVCLGLGEWDEEVKINEEQRARVINVSNQLSGMGYTVLTNYSSNEDWNEVLRWYNSVRRTQGELFEGTKMRQETRNSLKTRCILGLAEEASASNKLSLIKRWCVKPATINEVLTNAGYQKIGPSSDGEVNKQKWITKIEEFKKMKEKPEDIKLEITQDGNDNSKNITALEAMCKGLNIDITKTNSDKDFETKLNKARDWCFEKKLVTT